MKQPLLALVVSFLASTCLVAAAQGAGAADPYVGNVPTNCRVKVDHNGGKRKKPRVLVLVEVPNSRAHPKGTVKVVVRKKGGGVVFARTYASTTGRTMKFFAPRSARSKKYKARVTFTPQSGSVFLGCERAGTFRPGS
ncbi:hypothetical protein [Nocardioides dilutus]